MWNFRSYFKIFNCKNVSKEASNINKRQNDGNPYLIVPRVIILLRIWVRDFLKRLNLEFYCSLKFSSHKIFYSAKLIYMKVSHFLWFMGEETINNAFHEKWIESYYFLILYFSLSLQKLCSVTDDYVLNFWVTKFDNLNQRKLLNHSKQVFTKKT